MFSGQDDRKDKKGAKQAVRTKAGTERRQRQLMSVRHKTQGDLMKHLREDVEAHDGIDPAAIAAAAATDINAIDVWSFNVKSPPSIVPVALLPKYVQMVIHGETKEEVYQGALLIRKILSAEKNPPYSEVANCGVVVRLVELLSRHDFPELQFEAAWALTNLAAGTTEHTLLVVTSGAVPPLIALVKSPNMDCRDQACWALGNLAGENAQCRDQVMDSGGLQALLQVLQTPDQPVFVIRNAAWALSNVCRGRPQPELEKVASAVPVLAALLNHHDEHVVIDALWAISYISDGNTDRVKAILEAGVLGRVVELLSVPSSQLKLPAVRTIGNMAAGIDAHTQCVINAGAVPALVELMRNPKRALRKEACWTVSNIAAGQPYQIDALFSCGVFETLLSCLSASELDVRKEAVWSVANVSFCGLPEHMKHLVRIGVVPLVCDALRTYDLKIIAVALEALQLFLQLGEDMRKSGAEETNIVADQMNDCGGVTLVEKLQSHQSTRVYNLSYQIMQSYFGSEDDIATMGNDSNFMSMAFDRNAETGGTEFDL